MIIDKYWCSSEKYLCSPSPIPTPQPHSPLPTFTPSSPIPTQHPHSPLPTFYSTLPNPHSSIPTPHSRLSTPHTPHPTPHSLLLTSISFLHSMSWLTHTHSLSSVWISVKFLNCSPHKRNIYIPGSTFPSSCKKFVPNQGWEFAHQFSERIIHFLWKN